MTALERKRDRPLLAVNRQIKFEAVARRKALLA